jgi:hypothetical protein
MSPFCGEGVPEYNYRIAILPYRQVTLYRILQLNCPDVAFQTEVHRASTGMRLGNSDVWPKPEPNKLHAGNKQQDGFLWPSSASGCTGRF